MYSMYTSKWFFLCSVQVKPGKVIWKYIPCQDWGCFASRIKRVFLFSQASFLHFIQFKLLQILDFVSNISIISKSGFNNLCVLV